MKKHPLIIRGSYTPQSPGVFVYDTKSINCDTVKTFLCVAISRSNNGWLLGSAPAEYFAFHGHGFSLLAPARGMPTLSAKDGFSRPSFTIFPGSSDTCYSHRPRNASAAVHRTKKIGLYFRGVYVFCLRWGCFLMRLVIAHIINVSLSSSHPERKLF